MLDFPQDFFLEEVREGFTIDSSMKSFWAAEMEVLREIAEICERHGFQWYAAYGTLLGAIRHEGYVPWDDDLDIWMKREDYNKFIEVAAKELPDEYHVQSPLNEVGYIWFNTCVFNANTVSVDEERLRKFHGCPFAAGVDIFPLDYLPRNEEEREGQYAIYHAINLAVTLINKEDRTVEEEESLQELLDNIEDICGVTFEREKIGKANEQSELISSMFKLANQLCACYTSEDGDELVMYADYVNWPYKVYKKEWFDEVVQQPFEGFLIPVPAEYDAILRIIYGDYNVRVNGGTRHDYPLYNKQLKHLRGIVDEVEEKYARIEEIIAEAKRERLAEAEAKEC